MKKILTVAGLVLLFAVSVFAQRQAEVTVTSTYLRKTPDYNAEKLRTLQKGEKVTIEKGREAGGWTFVSTADGSVQGWILSNTIATIKNPEKVNQTPNPNPYRRPFKPIKIRRRLRRKRRERRRRRRRRQRTWSKTTTKFSRSIPKK
jgi:hypothetical protein